MIAASPNGVIMAYSKVMAPARRLFTAAHTLCIYAFVLLVLLRSTCLAQQPVCAVPVTVQAFDLSSFPKEYVDQALAWKQKSHGGQAARPGLLNLGVRGEAMTDAWTTALNIPPGAILARDHKHPVAIRSVSIDRGPRRIVFVADNGKEMTAGAQEIEAAVITHVLSKARGEDSFGLLTASGPRVELSLGAHREIIEVSAEKLGSAAQGKSQITEGVLDALLEASTWLQPPRPGDSIFLVAMRVEGRNKASASQVRRALATGRIRVFSFQLGPSYIPGAGDLVARSVARSSTSGEVSDGMFSLTTRTGGVAEWENTVGNRYQLNDARLQMLTHVAEQMYSAITEYYVLGLSSVTPHLSLTLTPEFQERQLVPMGVLFPRDLPPCRAAAGAKTSD